MGLDYKDFLEPAEPVVLPYLGGTRVDMADRRLRVEASDVTENLAPGWWRFQIQGRTAVPKRPARPRERPDLNVLPAVRGHFISGWVVVDGRQLHRIALPPDDEPAPLSRVVCRRWHSGDVLFDSVEFEDEAELAARAALEEGRPLADTKGVVPSLRAAFGYVVGLEVARELNIGITPRELTRHIVTIADGGRPAVAGLFQAILEQRRREEIEARRRLEEAQRRAEEAQRSADEARHVQELRELAAEARRTGNYGRLGRQARARGRENDPQRRADDVLDQAGARMIRARYLANETQLDITYEVDGTRILSIVDVETFQVLDPGICLDGAHRVLTLDAMPSVVREAIEDSALNITRRS